MDTEDDNHAHAHEFVEIIDSETITAFEHSPHGIVTLQLHQRGLSLDLTHEEAVALGMVMERVVEHVKAKRQR